MALSVKDVGNKLDKICNGKMETHEPMSILGEVFICLSSLLRIASTSAHTLGARVNRGAPNITHLLFADDCLIFGEATSTGANSIKGILDCYSAATGQIINFDKLGLFFSSNVLSYNRLDVQRILGISSTTSPEKYLGLPSMVGRDKKAAFANLRDRFHENVDKWCSRFYQLVVRRFL
ncbi:hypothetical protein V6N13_145819 [Hibiscus sabdariffa]